MYQVIKQLEEKNVANEVNILLWSDRMDLVAVANVKGEVALHRLTCVRAWNLPPYKEGAHVNSLAWKPDGQVIAIGYCTGLIMLVNVENKAVLHKVEIAEQISCMMWFRERTECRLNEQDEQKDYMKYLDHSLKFLPDPPPLTNFSSNNAAEQNVATTLQKQSELNILMVGTVQGLIFTSVFGVTPFSIFDLNQHLGYQCSILDILLSEDLNLMFVTVKDTMKVIKIVIVNTDIFKSHTKELFTVAMKFEYLSCLMTYISNTISVVKETWESILLEMDAKLSKYASKVPEGMLSADFLDLLTFGIVSDHMQEFLLHDLTNKGLEKFGHTIEMSYANIQKLLLKNVSKVGQNITYHLAEFRGMARFEYRYKILGLEEEVVTEAIAETGAFLNKSGEMQQVINTSMINYKAFFRWLFSAIMDLIGEQMPADIPKMTQQDLTYIMEFLQNFDNIISKHSTDGSNKPGFVMEKLGQYLVDAPLTIPSNLDENDWNLFLKQTDCVNGYTGVIRHYRDRSLVQQYNELKTSIDSIFDKPKSVLIENFSVHTIINCMQYVDCRLQITNVNCNPATVLFAFLPQDTTTQSFYLMELTVDNEVRARAGYVFVPFTENSAENYHLLDLQFYTATVLSVLMQDNGPNKFGLIYQCPVMFIRDKIRPIDLESGVIERDSFRINACLLGSALLRHTEGMIASKFAVSGCRRVAVVLSENKRKVRIYEMEAEEEDEDDGDMTTSILRESDGEQ